MARIRQAKHVIGEWWGEMGFQTCFSPHPFESALPCIDLSPDQQHYSTQLQWGYIEKTTAGPPSVTVEHSLVHRLIRVTECERFSGTFPTPSCRRISTSHELEAEVVRRGSFTAFTLPVILPSLV
jgi:hypothetical protein